MIGHSLGNLGLSSASLRTSLDNWAYNTYIEQGNQGIVYNTHEEMWNDMTNYSTGYPSNMPNNYPQYIGGVYRALDSRTIDSIRAWFQVEAGSAGPTISCAIDDNTSTNTMVEIGILRLWERREGVWNLRRQVQNTTSNGTSDVVPNPTAGGVRVCGLDESYLVPAYPNLALMDTDYAFRVNSSNRIEFRPDFYYRLYGATGIASMLPIGNLEGVCGTVYMRLTLKDPDGIDDRASSNFVAHIGSEAFLGTTTLYDNGIGRYKKVTNEWQPFNFYSFNADITPTTLQELIALDPPLALPDTVIPQDEIVENTYDIMWDALHGTNTGWVSNMPSGYAQFQGPVYNTLNTTTFDSMNIWIEVENGGDGTGCSVDTNTSTNTMVEMGYIRMWERRNGTWTLLREVKNADLNSTGYWRPNPGESLFDRPCGLDEMYSDPILPHWSLMNTSYGMRTNADGFLEVRPDYYYRWHSWCNRTNLGPTGQVEGVMGTVYMRLVLKDPNGIDDRATSNIVAHVGGDRSLNGSYVGGTSVSKYYKLTEKWMPITMFTFNPIVSPSTIEDFIALDPPVALEP